MTFITSHRGARDLWPENSLGGFRKVLALDVDAVEFDVHLTDAGELLVIHDATLDRTSDGAGPARALTPEKRATVRLRDCDETIPTLADVLEALAPAADKRLHVEIKSDPDGRAYDGIVERVVAEIDRHDLRARCHLTSFDVSVLEECRRVAADIPRLVSLNAAWANRQGGIEAFLTRVDALVDIVAVHHELMGSKWDEIATIVPAENLCVWTLNDEALIRKWLDHGIGHLTTDRPDLALSLRAQRRAAA
ncbi:glycerophosphodiester phosphodiesterase [Aliihoeflea aestuarii]|uniref:glycerophosphodiester phosphodiesterase family protein n=1 Tax=Aliihoeflea aestuarii TaxID=453840 RepID=UPI0020921EE0|nr:glycerophosphodiester phosphodiesterase family protein [Aliihoeflea aestuarii]MCO6390631.1 glycerophosphodiester phosphodiesterase [Aliihoeflea aestuarii]